MKSVQATLATRLPEVSFEEQPLERVIDWLRDESGTNIVVQWTALADLGVERDTPVSLRLKNLRFDQVLMLVLESAGGNDVRLGFRARDNLITVATIAELDRDIVTRVYDIGDLLADVPRFQNAMRIDATQAIQSVGSGGGSSGGSSGGGVAFAPVQNTSEDTSPPADRAEEIAELIRSTVAPDSWQENGGEYALRVYRSQLIVWAPVRIHQMIGGPIVE